MDGRAPYPRWKLEGIYESNLCPRRAVTDESRAWLELYGHYAKGHLWARGAVEDQPAIYLQAMQVVAATVSNPDG